MPQFPIQFQTARTIIASESEAIHRARRRMDCFVVSQAGMEKFFESGLDRNLRICPTRAVCEPRPIAVLSN
jgi:hypothetical protein